MNHLAKVMLLLPALALVFAACGGGGTDAGSEGELDVGSSGPGQLSLVMGSPSEFRFSPETLRLAAGSTVTLLIRNDGAVEHEWMVGRQHGDEPGYMTDMLAMMMPEAVSGSGYKIEGLEEESGEMHEEQGEEMHHGAEIEVEPGGSVTLQLTVPADAKGTWEMGCFITDHYEAGMKGTVTVE